MMAFSWLCPFCDRGATIIGENHKKSRIEFNLGNKYGYQAFKLEVITCPNPDCKEYTLSATVHDHQEINGRYQDLDAKRTWQLLPQSNARVFPDYVPKAILDDYQEACAIKGLSPKASATLARRCLQGMIRDFWSVKKGRLVDEIDSIKDRVDPMTWSAIDAIRKIGNIGAHMEKDINLIIDVEPQEASLLINLIETLINDWYVVREERKQRLEAIVGVADNKQQAKSRA
ncbi:DUF4145 domain-containing protein [Vibrio parahaemolyticus]